MGFQRKAKNKTKHAENGNVIEEAELNHTTTKLKKRSPQGEIYHYTDGALEKDVGAWAFIAEGDGAVSGPAFESGNKLSSTVPELMAVIAVLEKLLKVKETNPQRHTIWTDSAETARLTQGYSEWKSGGRGEQLVKLWVRAEHKIWIKLKWCKGHAGIEGNVAANKAAGIQLQNLIEEIATFTAHVPAQKDHKEGAQGTVPGKPEKQSQEPHKIGLLPVIKPMNENGRMGKY